MKKGDTTDINLRKFKTDASGLGYEYSAIELISTILIGPPNLFNKVNPLSAVNKFFKSDASRYLEPVDPLDSKAGIKLENTDIPWAYSNGTGFYLNMTDNESDY